MEMTKRSETWDPFHELDVLSRRFHRLLAQTATGNGHGEALAVADWAPSVDVRETDKDYRIRAELPSVKKDDVHVTMDKGVLTIRGERREEKEEKGVRFHRRELAFGQFLRRFAVPEDLDESKIEATFADGMLEVVMPKTRSREPRGAREIAVR
jgi:HSP20 family protein